MKRILTLLLIHVFISAIYGQNKTAYIIYNAKGKKVSYKKMYKKLVKKDIILFGEAHNNPISHWLQYELTSDLDKTRKLALGAEMIEADNQDELDLYLIDSIDDKAFDTLARLWPNYKTDYAPLVNYAKENNIHFTATNIPRRYANLVYRKGFEALDTLSDEEKSWMAPLPMAFDPDLPSYQNILEIMGDHGTPELVMAQSTKDATMAYFIYKNYKPGELFIHYNGSFHSDLYEGIMWYLKQYLPDVNYATITTVLQEGVNELLEENKKLADFIICVDSNMTTTY